ncbi:MAG: hypothetical protein JXA91_00905 [Candidatus Thermoplasmatota archaeon]|nr:hypothetical protein [Candidatus Thermoplasmatota archaeon]
MKRKIVGVFVCMLFVTSIIPISLASENNEKNNLNESEPEFEVGLAPGVFSSIPLNILPFGELQISIRNIGDATAHNIKLINLSADGNILFNSRIIEWKKDIEPDHKLREGITGMFMGFGRFNISMTVTCDEGVIGTGRSSGFILGFIMFIP